MTKKKDLQRLIRAYKDDTGEREVDMHKVAHYAEEKGWPMPVPADPLELFAKQLSEAAREQIAHDEVTGQPYRVNHAIPVRLKDGKQLHLWIDIDEAERGPMLKSLVNRREQMVGDGLQLKFDEQHWNRIHEGEEPIDLPMDLDFDIQLRMNQANDDDDKAA